MLGILVPASFHNAAAETIAAQAAPALLHDLFAAHSVLDAIEIEPPLARGTLGYLHAPLGRAVVRQRFGHLDVTRQLVMVTQELVDVARSHLSRPDGADHRRGAGLAVAAHEHVVVPFGRKMLVGD